MTELPFWLSASAAIIGVLASVATAVGVFLAWWQIKSAKNQSVTDFEDDLAREYRELTQSIPVAALLGKALTESEVEKALPAFYRYVDLSNEQTFLRQQGRVREQTWQNWSTGIATNLCRPAFRIAWEKIKQESNGDFGELRRLEASDFNADPIAWGRQHTAPQNPRLQADAGHQRSQLVQGSASTLPRSNVTAPAPRG